MTTQASRSMLEIRSDALTKARRKLEEREAELARREQFIADVEPWTRPVFRAADIARRAGVSRQAVSAVLSGHAWSEPIADTVREMIAEARQSGFEPPTFPTEF